MTFTRQHWILLIFTLGYMTVAGIYFSSIGDYEFVWYVAVVLILLALIGGTLKNSRLPLWSLWLLTTWGLLHMAGGIIPIGDHVLYAQQLLPIYSDGGEFTILKYDQVIHAYGFGVAALIIRHLLLRGAKDVIPVFWIGVIAVCASMGLGALNEIIEFIVTIVAPENGVGGYVNTALDLVSNGIGAIIAVFGASLLSRKKSVEKMP